MSKINYITLVLNSTICCPCQLRLKMTPSGMEAVWHKRFLFLIMLVYIKKVIHSQP